MRKVWSYLVGVGVGIGFGMLLVTFLSPVSGRELRANLRQHYADALTAARRAASDKRAELEKELQDLRNR
jgi:hypothetical protein